MRGDADRPDAPALREPGAAGTAAGAAAGAGAQGAAGEAETAGAARGADFFGTNLAALGSRLPELAALLRGAALESHNASPAGAPPLLEPLGPRRPGGPPSARLGGLQLHSAYDPEGEARRLAASVPGAADTVVLLGFGLGYVAEAVLALDGNLRVLACEADARTLAGCFAQRDLSALLASERLGFLVGGPASALIPALDGMGCRRAAILALRASEAAWPAWSGELRAAFSRFGSKEEINRNTLRRFGRLWVRNLSRNLRLIGELPGTARLEGRFTGLPALVLAAGPSLDAVLPRLAELRGRFLLVCVDTALRSVLRAGVEPDFLVVVDPQYWNWRHLEGLSSPSSILVSESAAWPACFRYGSRAAFLCSSLFPLGKAIEASVGEKGSLGAGGSVATTAWDLARVTGASPIYMAGLDLGFPEGKTHAEASLFEQRALQAGRRLAPAETAQAAALFSGGGLWASSRGGAPLRTDKRMSLYAWWFESRLTRPGSPPTFALGEEGLAIPGMPAVGLEELLSLPAVRGEVESRLAAVAALREDPEGPARAAEGLARLRTALVQAERAAREAAAEAEAARLDLAQGRNPAARLARLDSMDAELIGGGANDVIGFLMPPLEDLVGSRAKDLGESLSTSAQIYREVAESARHHLDILDLA